MLCEEETTNTNTTGLVWKENHYDLPICWINSFWHVQTLGDAIMCAYYILLGWHDLSKKNPEYRTKKNLNKSLFVRWTFPIVPEMVSPPIMMMIMLLCSAPNALFTTTTTVKTMTRRRMMNDSKNKQQCCGSRSTIFTTKDLPPLQWVYSRIYDKNKIEFVRLLRKSGFPIWYFYPLLVVGSSTTSRIDSSECTFLGKWLGSIGNLQSTPWNVLYRQVFLKKNWMSCYTDQRHDSKHPIGVSYMTLVPVERRNL